MDKGIFSITCTTCQARLVVRSEEAIGAILECPRCQSMVQVTPPPDWHAAAPTVETPTTHAGPPPLDRVATAPLALDLESPRPSLLATLLSPTMLVLAGAVVTLVIVLSGLWWLIPQRSEPTPEPVAAEIERPAVETERPAPTDEGETTSQPVKPSEPKPEEVVPETKAPTPEPALPEATAEEPPPTSSTEPQTADTQPAEPEAVPAVVGEPTAEPTEDAEQVEIKKAPPAQVDVAARLADPIAKIELTDMPLVKAIELLAAIGNFPVTINVDALTELGVDPSEPISVKLDSTTVGKVLRAVVTQKGLGVTLENGQVVVNSPLEYRDTLRKVRYTVADLTGEDEAAVAELAALVRKLVAPESWQEAGGRGTIEPEKAVLVVQQTGEVQQQVLAFCEKLRTARHKPLRSHDNPERFALTTRRAQARKTLAQPVSANFHEPTPLSKVLAFLGEAAHVDILVDHAALASAETSDRVEVTLTAMKQEIGAALDDLLRPLGLTYRVVGAHAIQVTTKEAAAERMELEFYPVGARLAKQDVKGPALVEQLRARIATSTWSDVGGPAEIYFDPTSECLIVLQSQSAQAALERTLETKAEGGGGKAE